MLRTNITSTSLKFPMLRNFISSSSLTPLRPKSFVSNSSSMLISATTITASSFMITPRRYFSDAEDLFDTMDIIAEVPKKQEKQQQQEEVGKYFPSIKAPIHFIEAAANSENNITTNLISSLNKIRKSKIEFLTTISAERREQGKRTGKLEKQFGVGASKEWLEFNNENNNNENNNQNVGDLEFSEEEEINNNGKLNLFITKSYLQLHSPASCSEKQKQLFEILEKFEKTKTLIEQEEKKNSDHFESRKLKKQQDSDIIGAFIAAAMRGVLSHSRSPSEARQALEFVAIATGAGAEKSMLVWTTAVEAASLALVTPEFFKKLLSEALPLIEEAVENNNNTNGDDSAATIIRTKILQEQLTIFYSSALAWCASQFELEIALRIWSSSLKTSSKLSSGVKKNNAQNSQSSELLNQLAFLIRSTGISSSSSSSSSSDPTSSGILSQSEDDFDPTRLDGGVRNSALSWIKKQVANGSITNKELEEELCGKMRWENFEAILSALDSTSGIELMKVRLAKKTKKVSSSFEKSENNNNSDNKKEEEKTTKSNNNNKNNNKSEIHKLEMLQELLQRFVNSADVTGAEQVSHVILSSFSSQQNQEKFLLKETNTKILQIKENTILLLMKLYSEKLNPSDFDSCLDIFTKYCRHPNSNDNLSQLQPTSEHYTLLLKAADSSDAASSLFLDACACGVVLDSSAYRFLFQRESNTLIEKLRSDLPQDISASSFSIEEEEQQQKQSSTSFDDEVLPPLPAGLDSHLLLNQQLGNSEDRPIPIS